MLENLSTIKTVTCFLFKLISSLNKNNIKIINFLFESNLIRYGGDNIFHGGIVFYVGETKHNKTL